MPGGKGKGKGGAQGIGDGSRVTPYVGGDEAATGTDDGGSSPLVPILIALAVLAAISIGAVAMRRRRQEGDPAAPTSQQAG